MKHGFGDAVRAVQEFQHGHTFGAHGAAGPVIVFIACDTEYFAILKACYVGAADLAEGAVPFDLPDSSTFFWNISDGARCGGLSCSGAASQQRGAQLEEISSRIALWHNKPACVPDWKKEKAHRPKAA